MQYHEVAFRVAFEDGLVCDVGYCGAPSGLKMACGFLQPVVETFFTADIFEHRYALHEIGDGDEISFDGDVDGGS